MGLPLCRGNSLRLCYIIIVLLFFSCCSSPSESAPLQAGYVFHGDGEFASITRPTAYKKVSTTYLVASPNDRTTLAFTIETSKTSGPVCYLEILWFTGTPRNYSSSRVASEFITPWTHPCPRTPLPNGNCSFEFTAQGEIRLTNSVAGLLWSSNSTGLGATTLDMIDYDLTTNDQHGVLALYNATGYAVWMNLENDDGFFQCQPPQASHAVKRISSRATSLVVLASMGVILLCCRGQVLVFMIVCCCVLLLMASPSESVPIEAGFSASLTSDYGGEESVGDGGAVGWGVPLVVSPGNRTELALKIFFTKKWGRTCYLEVLPDTSSTDIIRNNTSSAPEVNNNTFEYVPWSAPCPRKQLPGNGANCTFSFTKDGDIQLLNGYALVWSSNTGGLGATTLDVLDSDPTGTGSLVLLNAQNQVVWSNVRNAVTNQDFQCKNPNIASAASTPHSLSPLLLFSSATLVLFKFLM